MASHDPVAGSADLLTHEGEEDRAELKNQGDAALLVGVSRPCSVNIKLTFNLLGNYGL